MTEERDLADDDLAVQMEGVRHAHRSAWTEDEKKIS